LFFLPGPYFPFFLLSGGGSCCILSFERGGDPPFRGSGGAFKAGFFFFFSGFAVSDFFGGRWGFFCAGRNPSSAGVRVRAFRFCSRRYWFFFFLRVRFLCLWVRCAFFSEVTVLLSFFFGSIFFSGFFFLRSGDLFPFPFFVQRFLEACFSFPPPTPPPPSPFPSS